MPADEDRELQDFADLDEALGQALEPWRVHPGPLGLLFSGGVDSSLLAWELRDRNDLHLRCVGFEGSRDLAAAETAAEALGLRLAATRLTSDDLHEIRRKVDAELDAVSTLTRTVLISIAAAMDRAAESTVLCGQGADELFLGYAHYRSLSVGEADARSRSDLARLVEDEWPRTQRMALRLGHRAVAPYLFPLFVDAAQRIPIARRLPNPAPKALFRAFARHRGLPEAIASRPKRAIQYGTGIDRALRRGSG